MGQATDESRIALVIGNASYEQEPLRNPVNDARAMATTLRKLGFTVRLLENANKKAMEQAVLEHGRRLAAGGVGLFFYAGHGLQVRGRNYLVPVDARIDDEAAARVAAVDLELVLEQKAEAKNRVNLVILDACRNNPFERRMRGRSQGLAAVDAARGTLIAYATAPGSVASDGGTERNGLYTQELLRSLELPGLKIEEVFKRVRVAVSDRSKGQQLPWESSSLTGDLVINLTINVNGPHGTAGGHGAGANDRDALFWASIKDSTAAADYQAYLRQFPHGAFAELARRRLTALAGGTGVGAAQADAPPCRIEPFRGATSSQGADARATMVNRGQACRFTNFGSPADRTQPATAGRIIRAAANGTAAFMAPSAVYTPNRGFVGTDSFEYEASAVNSAGMPLRLLVRVTIEVVAP